MFDYNKIFEVKKINLEKVGTDTLIDREILDLGKDAKGERNWLYIEVWLDKGNAIKILQQNEYDTEEISDRLTEEQKNHIYQLVEKALNDLIESSIIIINQYATSHLVDVIAQKDDSIVLREYELSLADMYQLINKVSNQYGIKNAIFNVFNKNGVKETTRYVFLQPENQTLTNDYNHNDLEFYQKLINFVEEGQNLLAIPVKQALRLALKDFDKDIIIEILENDEKGWANGTEILNHVSPDVAIKLLKEM